MASLPKAEEILFEAIKTQQPDLTLEKFKQKITEDTDLNPLFEAFREYAKQVLDYVAENAKVENEDGEIMILSDYSVNKESILKIKNELL